MRLDHFLVRQITGTSRSSLGKYIRKGLVRVNGGQVKPGYRIQAGDEVHVTPPKPVSSVCRGQPVDFDVLFEDEYLAVISKPPGLVVHPAAGHADHTLVNGLLYRYGHLPGSDTNRPGIVHRLDKDTSGIMLIARTEDVQRSLASDFKNRLVHKTYHALLLRCPVEATGRIVAPVGRHPVNRKKMAVRQSGGRYAASRWQILERFTNNMCFAEIIIETGRTHQIRVHMASLGAPVAGDVLYGGQPAAGGDIYADRQLLHASTLSFVHPVTRQECVFTAPLQKDMEQVLGQLRKDCSHDG
jgi:23S rRNA pseudouridine1911/1915/1917 synthase